MQHFVDLFSHQAENTSNIWIWLYLRTYVYMCVEYAFEIIAFEYTIAKLFLRWWLADVLTQSVINSSFFFVIVIIFIKNSFISRKRVKKFHFYCCHFENQFFFLAFWMLPKETRVKKINQGHLLNWRSRISHSVLNAKYSAILRRVIVFIRSLLNARFCAVNVVMVG